MTPQMNGDMIMQGLSRCIAILKAIWRLLLYSKPSISVDYNKAIEEPLFVRLIGKGGRLRIISVKTLFEALKKEWGYIWGYTLGLHFLRNPKRKHGFGVTLGVTLLTVKKSLLYGENTTK